MSVSIPGTTRTFVLTVGAEFWSHPIEPGDLLEGPAGHGFLVERAERAPTPRYPYRWKMLVTRLGQDAIDHESTDDLIPYVSS